MQTVLLLAFGLLAGSIARLIAPGKEPGGWLASMLLGVVGSYFGAFVGRTLAISRQGEPAALVMPILGAIVLVAAYHGVARRSELA